jgi:multidrug resistance protein MdtO
VNDTLVLGGRGVRPGWLDALIADLRPTPGRLADTTRLVLLVLATVAIAETFRMPEIAVSAYVVLFVSRNERSSTVMTAIVAGLAVIVAAFATVVLFMASLSEPALRVPLIAVATFAALFFARISPLGPAAFAAGFIVAYGLTVGDQVLGLSLQSQDVSNVTGPGIPGLLFIPPEESLVQFVLWLAPVVALPVALVVAANLLTGRRPVLLLRDGLAARLAACADFCAGTPGAEEALAASARSGTSALTKLLHAAGSAPQPPDYARLIPESEQLALALLAWKMIGTAEDRQRALASCAAPLRSAERRLRGQTVTALAPCVPGAATDAARPLANEIARSSAAIVEALGRPPAAQPKAAHAGGALISAAAARDPATLHFALKVTFAVMLAYAAETLLDWPAIHTCVVTCFFVSLGTIGESLHKATLRIAGALVGGALGIGTILVFMAVMTDLGDLLAALAVVTFLAAWVATGSERISYAGWQIGLAYYLTVLQGYGPTLDMQTARDRVIGIVLGNLIVLVIFTTLWPVGVAQAVRSQVAQAVGALAALMRLPQQAPESAAPVRQAQQTSFAAATNAARGLLANAGYEHIALGRRAAGRIGAGTLAQLETLMLVLCVILNQQRDAAWRTAPPSMRQAAFAYHERMAAWFDRCAVWVATGIGGGALAADIPPPPTLDAPSLAAPAAWYGVLDRELRAIMSQITHRVDADA